MKQIVRYMLLSSFILMLSACGKMPGGMSNLFWETEENPYESDTASGRSSAAAGGESIIPSDHISPELYNDRKLPMAGHIGTSAGKLPEKYRKLLASHVHTLDVRNYGQAGADVFSATIDAMTGLNIPVKSVDSLNGIVTSDWVLKGENSSTMPKLKGYTRHRFVMRIYREGVAPGEKTRMEVRVLGQVYEKKRWLDKPLTRNVSRELFVAVEEYLARHTPPPSTHGGAVIEKKGSVQ